MATFTAQHEDALRAWYHVGDFAVGLSSGFGALCAQLARGRHKRRKNEPPQSPPADEPLPLEQWVCWSRSHVHRRSERAGRALAAISVRDGNVLWCVYGPRPAGVVFEELGPYARLAAGTNAVRTLQERLDLHGARFFEHVLHPDLRRQKGESEEAFSTRVRERKALRHALITKVREQAPKVLASAQAAFADAYDGAQ
jgi:hypothetical protein